MTLLGAVIGYLTGLSRAPAVSSVLPSALSLLGGLVLYIFTRKPQSRQQRPIAAISTIGLALGLLTGTLLGAQIRADSTLAQDVSLQQEAAREAVCEKRLAFEISFRKDRIDYRLPDVNPTLAVPGCTPPFPKDSPASVGTATQADN